MHLAQDFLKKNFCNFSSHFPLSYFFGLGLDAPDLEISREVLGSRIRRLKILVPGK